ncbi:MAG: hypothetical protein Q7S27_04360 [Nanoarchaeota archaeon]|nr:hypothetical protein [Nanoarchaeota archaeon]
MLINNKGESDLMTSYLIYLIILIVFASLMVAYVYGERKGGDIWSDYYSKEIVKVIDFAKEGDKVCLDVHRASVIGRDNQVRSYSEIFQIDNKNNDVCVKLSKGIKRCYNYFSDVDIVNLEFKLGEGRNDAGDFVNTLCFDVKKAGVEDVT